MPRAGATTTAVPGAGVRWGSRPPASTPGSRVLFSMHRATPTRKTTSARRSNPPGLDCCRAGCNVGKAAKDKSREARVLVRPLLENSTACRKSVPSNNSSAWLPFFWGGWVGFLWLIDRECQLLVLSWRSNIIYGEFDPGSGRTLAACLTHASRARPVLRGGALAANG